MTTSTSTSSLVDAWDFGGYPYGLAPLVLPEPGARGVGGDPGTVVAQLDLLRTQHVARADVRADSVEQLFWFRWIIGNQTCSALWQLLDDELGLVLSEELESAAHNAQALLDGYSALLIYAGTPTMDLYRRLIRPAMGLQHRSFSGRWALDYVPVMAKLQTLRARYRKRSGPDFITSLIGTSKLNHRVHVAVAAKLVPDDDSLLKSHDGQTLGAPTIDTIRLYDAFYATTRATVPREAIAEQALHRLRAICWDLRTNGLYPVEDASLDERPAALWGTELKEMEQDAVGVLVRAGEAAAASLRSG